MSGNGPSDRWERQDDPSQPVPPAPAAPPVYAVAQTNGLAIAALVCGIVWLGGLGSILALVLGYTAKGQIDRSGGREGGRGLAVAGIVLGWIGVAGMILVLLSIGCAASSGGDFGDPIIVEP